MGRLFESEAQRQLRSGAQAGIDLQSGLLRDLQGLRYDTDEKIRRIRELFGLESSALRNQVAEYLESTGVPLGSIRAVNLANALVPLSAEKIRSELGVLRDADLFNLQKLGMKQSIANSLANLYLAKAQGYSQFSVGDLLLTLANLGVNIYSAAKGTGGLKKNG